MSEKRKTISPIIGSYFKELRIAKNLKQNELGEELGISGAYIGFVENAKRLPSVEVVEKYASFFNASLEELLNLREMTIFETVDLLGDDAPPAIKNERNMIVHALNRPDMIVKDGSNNQLMLEVKANKKQHRVTDHGTILFDGKIIAPNIPSELKNDLTNAIKTISTLEDVTKLLDELIVTRKEIEELEAELIAREKEIKEIESQIEDENKK